MKKLLLYLTFIFLTFSAFSKEKEAVRIGILYDEFVSTHGLPLVEKEIIDLIGNEYDISFPTDKKIFQRTNNKNEINKNLDTLLNDNSVDIVISAGLIVSNETIKRDDFKKPVFVPLIFKNGNKVSKAKNLNYIDGKIDFNYQKEEFRKIFPFSKLTVILDEETYETVKELSIINLEDKDLDIVVIDNKNLDETISKIKSSQAIAMGLYENIDKKNYNFLINEIYKSSIPSFNILSLNNNKFETLGEYDFDREYKKRLRLMAINIGDYLATKKISSTATSVDNIEPRLTFNMEAIKKTNKWPQWNVLAKNKIINFLPENSEGALDLKEVIQIAMDNNQVIKNLRKEVEISDLNIKKAKSNYKPKLDFNATALQIDKDRAESVITPAEKTLSAEITLTQVILSEDLNMNVEVLSKQKKLKEEELKKAERDLVVEVSEAYFTVLKLESYGRIQKSNLELLEKHLNIAKEKKAIGNSGKADIFIFENEFSKNESQWIEIMLNIDVAKTNLKRIMNYDLNEDLSIKNLTIDNPYLITSNPKIFNYISNQNNIKTLVKFMLNQTKKESSDIKSLDYGIEIQKRLEENAKNKRYIPTVALQASYSVNNIISEGVGSEKLDISSVPNYLRPVTSLLGNPDDRDWSIGIGFKLPIYDGGELSVDRKIAEKNIESLQIQKNMTETYIEQQLISQISKIISEYSKTKSSEISLNSAREALKIIEDTYSKGVSSTFDLIDSQSTVFSAEQYNTATTYDLMFEIIKIERLYGDFYMLKSNEEKDDFLRDLELNIK